MAAYEEYEWELVESRRTLMAALDLCDGDLAETVRDIIEQLELVALAIAWRIPAAIEGHADMLCDPMSRPVRHELSEPGDGSGEKTTDR